jgi:hypothetical protein
MEAKTPIIHNVATAVRPGWSRRLHGEPSLVELLEDPILGQLMQRDGVSRASLDILIQSQRSRLCLAA